MIPSAGAMLSTTTYRPQHTSRSPDRKTNTLSDGEEPARKPKKVNSEIRKQQNRIASRNYREKRKRKLQYLQQLLRDGESPEQAAQTVEEQERMVTPEYHTQSQQPPVFVVPSNSNFQSLPATSSNAIESIFPSSNNSYDRQFGRTPPNYDTYDNTWSPQMYHSSPNVNISAWTIPSWMPNVDYATTASSRSDEFQYTPPSHTHHNFEQVPTPPQPSRTPDPDLFLLGTYGHYRRADSQQPMSVRNMSLPSSASSSPYHYTKYAGVP